MSSGKCRKCGGRVVGTDVQTCLKCNIKDAVKRTINAVKQWPLWLKILAVFFVLIGISGGESQNRNKLDLTKPVFTQDYAIICPLSLFVDRREDHGPRAIEDLFTSISNRDEKAKALGCEIWQDGIRLYISPRQPNNGIIDFGLSPIDTFSYFSMESHLRN